MKDFFENYWDKITEWHYSSVHFLRSFFLITSTIFSFILLGSIAYGVYSNQHNQTSYTIYLSLYLISHFFVRVSDHVIEYWHEKANLAAFAKGILIYLKSYGPASLLALLLVTAVYGLVLLYRADVAIKIVIHLLVASFGLVAGKAMNQSEVSPQFALVLSSVGILYAIIEVIVFLSLPFWLAIPMATYFIIAAISVSLKKKGQPHRQVTRLANTIFYTLNLSMIGYLIFLLS